MKKTIHLFFGTLLISFLMIGLQGCPDKKNPEPQTNTDKITRAWKVQQVDATTNGSTSSVYQEGGSSNAENYSAYRLNFISATNFRRTEKDGTTNTEGNWSFNSNEDQVTFDRGNPQTIQIQSLSENSLVFTYTETNAKGQSRELRFQMVPVQ